MKARSGSIVGIVTARIWGVLRVVRSVRYSGSGDSLAIDEDFEAITSHDKRFLIESTWGGGDLGVVEVCSTCR